MTTPNQNPPAGDASGPFSQNFKHSPATARVPDKVAHGTFSTGALVQTLASEFIIDFIQGLTRPASVAARVVVSHHTMQQMLSALQENLGLYTQKFGPPPALPKPPQPQRQPSIQEIYDELKLADTMMSGTYANSVMIGHTPSEFVMDFITTFYPKAAVSSRIYMSAAQLPRL